MRARVGPWPQVIAAGNRHRQARLRIWPSRSTLWSQRTSWRLSFSRSTMNKNVRRKVVEVIDCLDNVPNIRSMPARGQERKRRTSQQWKSGRTAAVRRRPSATDLVMRDGPFPQARKATPADHQGQTSWRRRSLRRKMETRSDSPGRSSSFTFFHSYEREEEPFRVEEMSSKRRSSMRVVGQRK